MVRAPGDLLAELFSYPARFGKASYTLFFSRKFEVHRLFGLFYLVQFAAAVYLEIAGRPKMYLFLTLPLSGVVQSIIACRTFTFLPAANGKTQGYYHNTRVMSYDFIFENIYFAGLLLFQSVYALYNAGITKNPMFLPLELIGVFLPYHTVRDFFPKSSFRDSIREGNKYAQFVKVFYITAKHFTGYYANYLLFLGKLGDDPVNEWGLLRKMLILGGWGTTIAMFLQTLKFRRYIGPTTAMILYVGVFPLFWAVNVGIFFLAIEHVWLSVLALVGIAVNFGPRKGQIAWQMFMFLVCLSVRYGADEMRAIGGFATVALVSYMGVFGLHF